ncbi:MAG TPA: class I SAM-dependent methyltransferase [Dehalococcoidia bacterium]
MIVSEPDPFMLEKAKKRLQELGPTNIELVQFPAENIPYEDGSFDHVVSSMVFCSVGEPKRALAEVRRVLKPTGTFRFIEHVRARNPVWGRLQDLIVPFWSWLGAGCHPNRRTLDSMTEAGLEVTESPAPGTRSYRSSLAWPFRRPCP